MSDPGSHQGRRGADATLVASLAAGLTIQSAADAAGVSERTVHRRLRDPDFRQRIADARTAVVGQAVARLSSASTAAVDALTDLLGSEMDFARLGAARTILELGMKLREHLELEERIRTHEEQTAIAGEGRDR